MQNQPTGPFLREGPSGASYARPVLISELILRSRTIPCSYAHRFDGYVRIGRAHDRWRSV